MSIRPSQMMLAFDPSHGHWTMRAAAWLRGAVRLAAVCYERAQQRRQLRSLDDRMLHDLGLSRADIDAEAAKPFWLP